MVVVSAAAAMATWAAESWACCSESTAWVEAWKDVVLRTKALKEMLGTLPRESVRSEPVMTTLES